MRSLKFLTCAAGISSTRSMSWWLARITNPLFGRSETFKYNSNTDLLLLICVCVRARVCFIYLFLNKYYYYYYYLNGGGGEIFIVNNVETK